MSGVPVIIRFFRVSFLLASLLLFNWLLWHPYSLHAQSRNSTPTIMPIEDFTHPVTRPTTRPLRITPKLQVILSGTEIAEGDTCYVEANLMYFEPVWGRVNYRFFIDGQRYDTHIAPNKIRFTPNRPGHYRVYAEAHIEYNPDISLMEMGGSGQKVFRSQPTGLSVISKPQNNRKKVRLEVIPDSIFPGEECMIRTELLPRQVSDSVSYSILIDGKVHMSGLHDNQVPCPSLDLGSYQVSSVATINNRGHITRVKSNIAPLVVRTKPPEVQPPNRQSLHLIISPNPVTEGKRCTLEADLVPGIPNSSVTYNFYIDEREISSSGEHHISCPSLGQGHYEAFAVATIDRGRNRIRVQSTRQILQVQQSSVPTYPSEPPDLKWPLIGIIAGVIVFLLIKPHPSMVIAASPVGLDVRIVQGKKFSQDVLAPGKREEFHYIFTFDRGNQTVSPQLHNGE